MTPTLIIIPIYKGLTETASCIESVITSLPLNKSFIKILLINDCSPEPELVNYLNTIHHLNIELIHNKENLGFVGTVNRGMNTRNGLDVILLNSDTEVNGDWVDRMRSSSLSDPQIATVTPFSNNATICSFPLIAKDNDLIFDQDFKAIDDLFSQMPATTFEIPTGVGFCMYIKDQALNDVGLFDIEAFGKGYGEENDFCQRAIARGWKNVLLGNTFVYHKGQTSFQETRDERVLNAIKILNKRYPRYELGVHQFINKDPAHFHRLEIILNVIRTAPLIKIACIHQGTGGGVVHHINELGIFYRDKALMILIYPSEQEEFINVMLHKGLTLSFNIKTEFELLVTTLKQLNISHLHYHHLMRLYPSLWNLAEALNVRYDATLHDFYIINGSPTLTYKGAYIGELAPDERNQKSALDYPLPKEFTQASWHKAILNFLQKARFVFTPSSDTAKILKKEYPEIIFTPTYPPEAHDLLKAPPAIRIADINRPLHVVIIGAISQEKGADIIQKVANLARQNKANICFTIMGYGYREIKNIKITGAYKEREADSLLTSLNPDIIWLPAIWPETYSYTLSIAIRDALPVLAFEIGAFKERLQARTESFLLPLTSTPEAIFAWLKDYHNESPTKPLNSDLPTAATDFYHTQYLIDLDIKRDLSLSAEKWQIRQLNVIAQNAQGVKVKVLKVLLKVKRLPIISNIIDLVPVSFQRKIKRFLSRRPITEL